MKLTGDRIGRGSPASMLEPKPLDCRTKWYGGMLVSQIGSDAVAHRMVSSDAVLHKMVNVKTVSDALPHHLFPIRYQIDATLHKMVSETRIRYLEW